jgi:uncharacterized protein
MSRPIVFFEITGPDAAALESFYGAVLNWTVESRPFPNYAYTRAGTGPGLRAGFRQEAADVPPERLLYAGVPNVQETLDAAVAAGATIAIPTTTFPGVGTFAVFVDPAGNRMGLWEHADGE